MSLARSLGLLVCLTLTLTLAPARPSSATSPSSPGPTTSVQQVAIAAAAGDAKDEARRPRCKRAHVVCVRRGASHRAHKLVRAYRHHEMGHSSVTHRASRKLRKEFKHGARRAGVIPCARRCPRVEESTRYRWDGWKDYFGWFINNLKCNVATGMVPGTSPDDLWAASCYDVWGGHNYQAPAYIAVTCGGAAISAWYRDPRLGPVATATAIAGARAQGGFENALVCGFSIAAAHAFDQ